MNFRAFCVSSGLTIHLSLPGKEERQRAGLSSSRKSSHISHAHDKHAGIQVVLVLVLLGWPVGVHDALSGPSTLPRNQCFSSRIKDWSDFAYLFFGLCEQWSGTQAIALPWHFLCDSGLLQVTLWSCTKLSRMKFTVMSRKVVHFFKGCRVHKVN